MVHHVSPIPHNVSANHHPQSPRHAGGPTRENIDLSITLADASRAFFPGSIEREHTVHNCLHLGPPTIAEDFQAIPYLSNTVLTKALVAHSCDIHRCVDLWCFRCLQLRQTPLCVLDGLHNPNEMDISCRLSLCQ